MDGLITLAVIGVGGYLAYKIFWAAMDGLGRFGDSLERNLPAFFEKVFYSLASGAVAGFLAHYLFNSSTITSAGALGGALASLAIGAMKSGGGSDMG